MPIGRAFYDVSSKGCTFDAPLSDLSPFRHVSESKMARRVTAADIPPELFGNILQHVSNPDEWGWLPIRRDRLHTQTAPLSVCIGPQSAVGYYFTTEEHGFVSDASTSVQKFSCEYWQQAAHTHCRYDREGGRA